MTIYVDLDGVIYKPGMKPFGYFDINGDVYNKDNIRHNGYPLGTPCGFVDIVGDVYKGSGTFVGFVDVDGMIYTSGKMRTGRVYPDGNVLDIHRNHIATVNLKLHKKHHEEDWRPMPFRVAGAIIFLLDNYLEQ